MPIEVSTHIDAPADKVWELIGNPTRMGELSPECYRVEWVNGSTAPTLQAKFKGHNRLGWRKWSTVGTIVELEDGSAIAWDVDAARQPVARWGYRITADTEGSGCTVTETWVDRRNKVGLLISRVGRGVGDTEAHNRASMEQTLARLKAKVEGTA